MKPKAILAIISSILLLAGCSVSVSPDGTQNFALDMENAAKAYVTYSSK
jgi:PBP1b-binding outer membrane lipoprotein LpoB